jgi:hypothetical protein
MKRYLDEVVKLTAKDFGREKPETPAVEVVVFPRWVWGEGWTLETVSSKWYDKNPPRNFVDWVYSNLRWLEKKPENFYKISFEVDKKGKYEYEETTFRWSRWMEVVKGRRTKEGREYIVRFYYW